MTVPAPRRTAFAVLLAASCFAWGCASRRQAPSARQASSATRWQDGSAQFSLTMPSRPRQLDPTDLTLTIRDGAGAVSGAQVSADLAMPEMPMPDNKTPLTMISPGVYRGSARFTMAGRWKVTLTVRTPGEATFRHILDPVTVE